MTLFNWGKKNKGPTLPETLHFKGPEQAFEHACEFMTSEIKEKQALAALVMADSIDKDAVQLLIDTFNAKRDENIFDTYRVQVSGDNGGFPTAAVCYKKGANVQPGTLVYWIPMDQNPMLSMMAKDKRSAWQGCIVARLEPSFSMRDGWVIAEEYIGS